MPENLLHPAGYVAELDKEGLSIEGKGLAENGLNRDFVGGQIMRKPIIKKSELWKAIKLHCFQCSGESLKEQQACEMDTCPLWKFRLGPKTMEKMAYRASKNKQ